MSKPSSDKHDLNQVAAGRAIRENSEALINRWLEHVKSHPAMRGEHRADLRDHLPALLDRLGQDLMRGNGDQSLAGEKVAELHGQQRWQLGWRLDEVVRDYQTLRPLIVEFLNAHPDVEVTPPVQSKVATLIDEAIIDSLRSYTEFQDSIEDSSHRTAAEFAAIISSSTDAIISMDIEGRIHSWNLAAEKMYGYTAEEAIGQLGDIIFPGSLAGEFQALLATIRQGQSIPSTDTLRVTKSGKELAVAASASPLCNRFGEIIGCATIAHDISQRVRAADALKRALEEAELANKTKNQFLANVSHELRSPMNAIIGMTALALDEELPAEVRDNLLTVREAAEQLNHLVDDLLDISKLEAGKFELEEGVFSLRRTLEDTMRVAGLRAYQKGIEIACHIEQDVPDTLIGDAMRLRQVLNNLVSNAIKFTEQGEVLVEAELKSSDDHHCQIAFRVIDSGIGIAKEDHERIFTPFTQADSSSTRKFGGTGLGLSIASHLVACLGGELTLESSPGEGSVFTVVANFRRPSTAEGEHELTAPFHPLAQVSALVVDDNETNRSIVEEMLANWGIRVVAAESANLAIDELEQAIAREEPYQLLLVDALMPGMNGLQLVREVARLGERRPACVLMIAPSDRLAMREQCRQSGVDAFLEKPISQSGMFHVVTDLLASSTVADDRGSNVLRRTAPARKLSVLVVEDTLANRKVVQRVLERRGHECVEAGNGREALELARSRKFDVILMDVQMPIMDGFQATAAIREWELQQPESFPTPIIAMTAHAMRGDSDRCLAAGMTEYLAKPIDVLALAEMVERLGSNTLGAAFESPDEPAQAAAAQHSQQGEAHETAKSDPAADEREVGPRVEERAGDHPAEASETVDLDAVLQRLRGDRQLLADLVACYLKDYGGLLDELQEALVGGDAPTARRSAHSIKGIALNFDATRTPRVASVIEEHAQANRLDEAAKLLPSLREATAQLAELLTPHARLPSDGG